MHGCMEAVEAAEAAEAAQTLANAQTIARISYGGCGKFYFYRT